MVACSCALSSPEQPEFCSNSEHAHPQADKSPLGRCPALFSRLNELAEEDEHCSEEFFAQLRRLQDEVERFAGHLVRDVHSHSLLPALLRSLSDPHVRDRFAYCA